MQHTILNFINQHFFVGIDVHLKQWKVTVRSAGIELKTFSMNPSPQELYPSFTVFNMAGFGIAENTGYIVFIPAVHCLSKTDSFALRQAVANCKH